jgi:hypothetical protein
MPWAAARRREPSDRERGIWSVTLKRSLAVLSLFTAVTVAAAVALSRSEPSPQAGGAAATAVPLPSLVGVVSEGQRLRLARVDSDTLRTRPGRRVGLGSQGCASPDRSILAVARNDGALARSVRLVDAGRMRAVADIRVTGGAIGLLAWPAGERVLALQETCCDERQQLLSVDVASHKVVGRRQLGGTVVRVGRTPRELVLLLAPAQKVGAARLAVVGARGAVRFLRLERILAGERLLDRSEHRFERQLPGLAVDPQGRRAFVAGPDVVADVDLVKLRAAYHEPVQSASALSRLRDWLDPAAEAKGIRGPTRSARWLGRGLLAVAGADEEWFTDDRGEDQTRIRAAGLSIVDTHDWRTRQAEGGASDFRVAGDLLLATGGSWDSATGKQEAIGLAAYGFDGARRFHRFDGREAWIDEIYDGRAYVSVASPKARSKPEGPIIDLVSGRTLGRHPPRLPRLLLDAASSWWDGG